MRLSKRLDRLPPYLFLEISRKIAEKRARGEDVVTFGIGDPDIPTPKHILDKIAGETYNPPNHRYPETDGLPAASQGHRRLVRPALRPGAGPQQGSRAAHWRQGGDRPRRLLLRRPGRRGPHTGPGLSGLQRRDPLRRRRAILHASEGKRTAGSQTSTPYPQTSLNGQPACGSTIPTTPPAPSPRPISTNAALPSPAAMRSPSSPTPPTAKWPSTATSP